MTGCWRGWLSRGGFRDPLAERAGYLRPLFDGGVAFEELDGAAVGGGGAGAGVSFQAGSGDAGHELSLEEQEDDHHRQQDDHGAGEQDAEAGEGLSAAGQGEADGEDLREDLEGIRLGDLEALQGVVKFPVRIKCATLAWNTLQQGLDEIESDDEAKSDTG